MFDYTHGKCLMAKKTHLLMLKTMLTGVMPGAADPTIEDLHKAHGQVHPGTKKSHSQSRSLSSEGTTGSVTKFIISKFMFAITVEGGPRK
jgi:hypothetical protein